MAVTSNRRSDWRSERERIDLAAVATSLLGPAPGRRGEHGRRLWWPCPFHDDRNPSFCVEPGKGWWRCFGCGESGDAAALAMRLRGLSFPEARDFLTGGPAPSGKIRTGPKPPTCPRDDRPAIPSGPPSGMPPEAAAALVAAAAARLWTPEGASALAYLTGPGRCLAPGTIRAARLGWTSWVAIPRADGSTFNALGVVVPWFSGDRLALVKIRQPDGRRPKYAEAFRDPAALTLYPGPEAIRPGRPLVIVEGEFDALALGEALGSWPPWSRWGARRSGPIRPPSDGC